MNAAAANVAAFVPSRSISEVWFPLLLMIFGGFCVAKILDLKKEKDASKLWYVVWILGMALGIFGGVYMYTNNKSPANIARVTRERASILQNRFAAMRAPAAAPVAPVAPVPAPQ